MDSGFHPRDAVVLSRPRIKLHRPRQLLSVSGRREFLSIFLTERVKEKAATAPEGKLPKDKPLLTERKDHPSNVTNAKGSNEEPAVGRGPGTRGRKGAQAPTAASLYTVKFTLAPFVLEVVGGECKRTGQLLLRAPPGGLSTDGGRRDAAGVRVGPLEQERWGESVAFGARPVGSGGSGAKAARSTCVEGVLASCYGQGRRTVQDSPPLAVVVYRRSFGKK